MEIPKQLKVGGHLFQVIIEKKSELGENDLGMTDKTKNIIYISEELSESQKYSTLIHEIFHIINATLEHNLLDSLSEQLYQVLSDNNLLKE